MSRISKLLQKSAVRKTLALRTAQFACFALTPAVMIAGIESASRLGSTPGEVLNGVLASSAVAMCITIIGLVLPQSMSIVKADR